MYSNLYNSSSYWLQKMIIQLCAGDFVEIVQVIGFTSDDMKCNQTTKYILI